MRRCIAILIALTFSWMLILPALASTTETSNTPACCRNNGKHHCQMKPTTGFTAVGEKCPYSAHSLGVPNIATFRPGTSQSVFAGLIAHPAGSPQTEAGYRASHYRAKQKRGPPSLLS
jgi:hypothetical protein